MKILLGEGDSVEDGQTIMIIEAMKMETEVKSMVSGTIGEIAVKVGDQVTADQVLVKINL